MHPVDIDTERPVVFVAEDEYDELSRWAQSSHHPAAHLLERELSRAVLVKAGEPCTSFVRLNSLVEYKDLVSGRTRTVQLVAPGNANADENRISILSPAGAALLGLKVDDTFGWTTEDGRPRLLIVNRVQAGAHD